MSYQDLIPLVLTEIIGDFGYESFANHGGIKNFATGTISYIGVVYYLIRSLQGSNILLINGVWDGLSALIESLAAFIILGERFETWREYFGLFLIIVGLIFLKIPFTRKNKFVFPSFFN